MSRILLTTLAVLIAGCTDGQDSGATVRKPLGGDVRIELKVTEHPGHTVSLYGTTNLPTDTLLMLSVKERSHGGFYGQAKCSVLADGSFQSESFGPASGLKEGVYVADVVMPIPQVQPNHVQQIVGEKGEKLTGPLVKVDDIGVTATTEHEFVIGGTEASKLQSERAQERVRQYRPWLGKIKSLYQRLQAARSSNWLQDDNNTANLAKWGEFARRFSQDFQSHQEQLQQVEPDFARMAITIPLGDVGNMFNATAFRKPQDYEDASAEYSQSIKELEKYVDEVEATQ